MSQQPPNKPKPKLVNTTPLIAKPIRFHDEFSEHAKRIAALYRETFLRNITAP
jgi:hypothetical protein